MGDEMNLCAWRMCREARALVREIYRRLPDTSKNSFHTQVRRLATQMLCNLSESQTEKSRKQAYFLLAASRSACMEICHMLRSPRYYRYIPEEVCGNLDMFCRKMIAAIGKEMEKTKPGRRRLHTVKPGLRARKKTDDPGTDAVKGKE